MNFEFPLKELPAVKRGPRVERRRVLIGGSTLWGTLVADREHTGYPRLDDGRLLDAHGQSYLPPVNPSKTIAVHISYTSRSLETRNKTRPTQTPTYFTKPPTSLNGHEGQILKPADCRYLNYEGEYAVVIGRTCRNVTPEEAWDHIEGFRPALDMGLQEFRADQGSMLRVKGADTLLPIAPALCAASISSSRRCAPMSMASSCRRRTSATSGPHYVIADPARHITLIAGDVILMAPCHSRSIGPGQRVECEITGIGRVAGTGPGTVVPIEAPRAAALGVGHAPTDSAEMRRVALGFDERVPERFKDNLHQARSALGGTQR